MLHALALELVHPLERPTLSLKGTPPEDFRALLHALHLEPGLHGEGHGEGRLTPALRHR